MLGGSCRQSSALESCARATRGSSEALRKSFDELAVAIHAVDGRGLGRGIRAKKILSYDYEDSTSAFRQGCSRWKASGKHQSRI